MISNKDTVDILKKLKYHIELTQTIPYCYKNAYINAISNAINHVEKMALIYNIVEKESMK